MRRISRFISLTLCIIMLLQMLPASAFAAESKDAITAERLTAYCVDTSTGEEVYGFGKGPFDLTQQKNWGSYEIVPAVWDENWTQRTDLTSGTTEYFWCYSFDKNGFCPVGMMPGKWGELVQQHQEKNPDDYENILLINATEGWTTDPSVPVP